MPLLIIAAALLLIADQAPTATKPVAPAVAADPDKIICKTIGETGSRLGGKRECKPRAEWERIAAELAAKAAASAGR